MRILIYLILAIGWFLNSEQLVAQSTKILKTTVEFEIYSAALREQELEKLSALAPLLLEAHIALHAYLDELTEIRANDSLSYLRANNVKLVLIDGGVPSQQIQIYYYNLSTGLNQSGLHNRRVVLEAKLKAEQPMERQAQKDTTVQISVAKPPAVVKKETRVASYWNRISEFKIQDKLLIEVGKNRMQKGIEELVYTEFWQSPHALKKVAKLTTENTYNKLLKTLGAFRLPDKACRFIDSLKLSLTVDTSLVPNPEQVQLYREQQGAYITNWARRFIPVSYIQNGGEFIFSVTLKEACKIHQLAVPITANKDTLVLVGLGARKIDFHCFKQRLAFENGAFISALDSLKKYNHYQFNSPEDAQKPYLIDFRCLGANGRTLRVKKLSLEKVCYYDDFRQGYYAVELEEIKVKILGMDVEYLVFVQASIDYRFKGEVHDSHSRATLFQKLHDETQLYVKLKTKSKSARAKYIRLDSLAYDEKNAVYLLKPKDLFR